MKRQVDACVAAGVHGVAVLGIVGEMNKLDLEERREVMDWVAEDLDGRRPLAVTVSEPNLRSQIAFVEAAKSAGADWVVLQPPAVKGVSELEYVDFFGTVAAGSELPVAIQNNPVNLDVWLSNAALNKLQSQSPNVILVKQEGPVTMVRQMIEETDGNFDVFSGLGGKEIISSLRAGCVGVITVPDCVDVQARIFNLMKSGKPGDEAEAERLYREILPLVLFMTHAPEHMLCYGKRLMARRMGLEAVHPRHPAVLPSDFSLSVVETYARTLGPF